MSTRRILLPAEEKSKININSYRTENRLILSTQIENYDLCSYQTIIDRGYLPQHLYFTKSETIRPGDYFYNAQTGKIHKAIVHEEHILSFKVIKTTDVKLNLPQPTQEYLKYYCEMGGI